VKRKLLALAAAAVGFGMMGSAARAGYVGQIILNTNSLYSSGHGGEFNSTLDYAPGGTIVVASQVPPVQQISPEPGAGFGSPAGDGVGPPDPSVAVFQTFCIQEGVNDVVFSPGTFYAATFEGSATTASGGMESVTPLTAALFDLFWNGNLTGYDYNNTNSLNTRQHSAGELQAAIWDAQGDSVLGSSQNLGDAGVTDDTLALLFEAQAAALVATNTPTVNPVVVLGLYDSLADYNADQAYDALHPGGPFATTGIAQAQLVEFSIGSEPNGMLPLPSAGSQLAVMLGAIGLFGLVRRSRILA
jgi:hypothetical protein